MQSWDALRLRTSGHRRMYGLHHRALPTRPLAFTSVALRDTPAGSLPSILLADSGSDVAGNVLEGSGPRVAMFYSLCATQPVWPSRRSCDLQLSIRVVVVSRCDTCTVSHSSNIYMTV